MNIARDLLYKYFGQLELLELRFAEIRVNFPWRDAFTNKLTTQTSIAYEKACIIFQIAATHSAIAASQNRSDPEGLKRPIWRRSRRDRRRGAPINVRRDCDFRQEDDDKEEEVTIPTDDLESVTSLEELRSVWPEMFKNT